MKIKEKLTKRIEEKEKRKKEKTKESWLLKIPVFRKIHDFFGEDDRYVLKWCGIIFLILILTAGLYQVKIYREKTLSINISANQDRYYLQSINTPGYEAIPQYLVTVNNRKSISGLMVITPSEINDGMLSCTLNADQSQFFSTVGTTENRNNLFVYLENKYTLEPATLRKEISFLMGIDQRKISGGNSVAPSGVISLYYIRFSDSLNLAHDYLIITFTVLNGNGQSLFMDYTALSFDNLKKEARSQNEEFSLASTLSDMTYLDNLVSDANTNRNIFYACQTTTPVTHPFTLRNLMVNISGVYVINSEKRADLEQKIEEFAEKAKIYADEQDRH